MRHEDVFSQQEPPRGGLARLRASLREPRRPVPWLVPAAALSAAVIAAVAVVRRPHASDDLARQLSESPAGWALGFAQASPEPVVLATGETGALARVPTVDPHIVFYMVASTEPDEPGE